MGFFSMPILSWHIVCQLNLILLTIPAPVCNLWCFFPSSWLCMCLTQAQFHSLAITFFQIGLYYQAIKPASGNSCMCCSLHCLLLVTGNEEECECYKYMHVTTDWHLHACDKTDNYMHVTMDWHLHACDNGLTTTCMWQWTDNYMHVTIDWHLHACDNGLTTTCMWQNWQLHACDNGLTPTCMWQWTDTYMHVTIDWHLHACDNRLTTTCMWQWTDNYMHVTMDWQLHACDKTDNYMHMTINRLTNACMWQ